MRKAPFVIRQATPADIPVVLRFIAKKADFDGCPSEVEATEERLREALFGKEPLAGVLLGEVDNVLVGFASYFATYSTFLARPGVWMDDLFVDTEWRGRGLGRAILAELARMAVEKGCGRIEWTAGAHNERGIRFYRRHGAQVQENARLCRLDWKALVRFAGECAARSCDDHTRRSDAGPPTPPTASRNATLVKRFYVEMWNRFDVSLLPDLLTEGVRFRGSLGQHKIGRRQFAEYVEFVQRAFPDFTNQVEEIVTEGEQSFARLTYRGTHQGELFGIAPTNRRVEYAGAALFRFRAGRIAEVWVLGDLHGLMEQLTAPGDA
jgi:steroid delta-isomerase-like uncharacterized protein